MRVFLDANILFSASIPKSRMRLLVLTLNEYAHLLTSPYAIEEARRNLHGKKPDALPDFERLLKHIEIIAVAITSLDIALAPKDIPILGGAIAGKATHLLTGDKQDFGVLWGKTIQGVKIVSPELLARELTKKGWLSQKRDE